MSNLLIIPPDGLWDLYLTDSPGFPHEQVEKYLRLHGEGTYVTLQPENHAYEIGMLLRDGGTINKRAREACVHLFGWHMIFTGPVALGGLNNEQVRALLEELS